MARTWQGQTFQQNAVIKRIKHLHISGNAAHTELPLSTNEVTEYEENISCRFAMLICTLVWM